jgi:predicted GIY-YIG superfamily endonuclease
MFTVYVLRSEKTGTRYIGCTESLERRLIEHHSGQTKSTRGKGPWELIHSETFQLAQRQSLASAQWLDSIRSFNCELMEVHTAEGMTRGPINTRL